MHYNFPQRKKVNPKIYAYELPGVQEKKGMLKIGYTTNEVEKRIKEQIGAARLSYRIVFSAEAVRDDGSVFMDYDIHRLLRKKGVRNPEGEWFCCSLRDLKAAFKAVKRGEKEILESRDLDFSLRPEQERAIKKTENYFQFYRQEKQKAPHFLWNAKMRFGKTFTAYKLAEKMNFKKILVLTFKPAVEDAWEEDLRRHKDFAGWQFYSKSQLKEKNDLDFSRPVVVFGSLQDYLGRDAAGHIKERNKWVHKVKWDLIIFDEYHYGAWNQRTKKAFREIDEKELSKEEREAEKIAEHYFSQGLEKAEEIMPIKAKHYLYLSGTPFRAIDTGEFIEDQIFNWTYIDEQKAKKEWKDEDGPNPYAELPEMVMMVYQVPKAIEDIARGGEFNEFDLNVFFSARDRDERGNKIKPEKIEFVYKEGVQKWLDYIRGNLTGDILASLKSGAKKSPFPFSDVRLRQFLTHTFWFLPSVASCYAMRNLMQERQNSFFRDYKIIVAAGPEAGIGLKALEKLREEMGNPFQTKTITLSTGKLTTGVTVKPWSAVFMLRNLSSPETYFQTAFRVQSPWTLPNPDGKSPNKKENLKEKCFVFDFAPNRALTKVSDYSSRLGSSDDNPEKRVNEFINFLPVLFCDEKSPMRKIDAKGVLDIVMSGTTATLLARRWESAVLVNVDNKTLRRLMANKKAMEALMNIEGFRSLNQDVEAIINKSETIVKLKKKAEDKGLTSREKKQLSQEEKEYKSKRKQIQEKLIKFATRIPVFMYLTDFREQTLKDVITQLDRGLFKKVTGLTVTDFELLVKLNLFNSALMNDAVYKFKRYEDASLSYVGFSRHQEKNIGGFDEIKQNI